MIKKLKRTLIVVGMFVLMMEIGTNIQVKADTLGQVKSIKTKTNYKYYKGIVSAKDMRKKKIKYKYGIKASWKKVKNANGYEIYVYGVASKKWRKIKDTKKTSYVFTNLLEKDKFKFKVRAYRKINGERVYGNWSKKKTIKTTLNCRENIMTDMQQNRLLYCRMNIEKVLENKVSFGRMFYMKYVKQGQSNLLMISVIINL